QVELTQPDSMSLQTGQSLTLSCKVSGYSFTDNYCTAWIRQPAGKALEWIGDTCGDGKTYYSNKLKNKFSISKEASTRTVPVEGQNLLIEDTAMYYCTRRTYYPQ
uniref:Immunoglobulin heavy variable 5-3 n=1 Tax=Hucho hucho TaxID=62062 RepID=A0A4W5N6P3_9TELE